MGMSPNPPSDITAPRYKRHRFLAEIIALAVWLYFRFPPGLSHVEGLLAERGIEVSFHGPIANLFHLHRKHLTAADHRDIRGAAMAVWNEVVLSTAA